MVLLKVFTMFVGLPIFSKFNQRLCLVAMTGWKCYKFAIDGETSMKSKAIYWGQLC